MFIKSKRRGIGVSTLITKDRFSRGKGFLGPVGFAVGSILASGAGAGISAALGSKKGPGYSTGDIDYLSEQRSQQINQFAEQLAMARQKFAAQLPKFQQFAFSRFAPQAESMFAGRGLQVTGGSFQAELARKAAEFEADQMLFNLEREREDYSRVDTARGNLFGARVGGEFGNIAQEQSDPLSQYLGQVSSGLLSLGLDKAYNTPSKLGPMNVPKDYGRGSVVGSTNLDPYGVGQGVNSLYRARSAYNLR